MCIYVYLFVLNNIKMVKWLEYIMKYILYKFNCMDVK